MRMSLNLPAQNLNLNTSEQLHEPRLLQQNTKELECSRFPYLLNYKNAKMICAFYIIVYFLQINENIM